MSKVEIAKLKTLISQKKDRIAGMKINYRGLFGRNRRGPVGNSNTKAMRNLIDDQEFSLRKLEFKLIRAKHAA